MTRRIIYLAILMIFISTSLCFSRNSKLDGSWEGKVKLTPEMGLRLVINILDSEGEKPVVTLDSPDQGAYGIPMDIDYLGKDSLELSITQLALNYKAKLSGDSLNGFFTQGPLRMPLILKPKKDLLKRPQTPQPPFPYETQEITFKSTLDGSDLFGTLTLPNENLVNMPAVLLISGSGIQNRDEEVFEHKPFAVIADYLARNGIATLRYDDRGYDSRTNKIPDATTLENAKDALGGLNYLKEKGFAKIGMIGHSEGGLIADILESNENIVDFMIEMGGPAISGDSILIFQNEFLLRDGGLPEKYIFMYIDAMKDLLQSNKDLNPKPFEEERYEIFSSEYENDPIAAPLAKNLRDNFLQMVPWLKYFINYNPLVDLKKIEVPVLMLYGERDTQVPPSLNVPILEQELPEIQVKVYPELNHLMQHSKTGKVTEYADIEETISPEVLEDIKSFILSVE